jgi:2-methylcitrate dehydratase PrpD
MSTSRAIAAHVSGVATAAIPKAALAAARAALSDTLAVGLAGADAAGGEIVLDLARQDSGRSESTVWHTGDKLCAGGATLVNSFHAGALDYDSLHPAALVHPAICTVPAALAVGERTRASGSEVVASIAIADDLMCRMGLAHGSNRGWYFTALYGGMAAAIAASRLMRLDARRVENALGLAFIAASGTQIGMVERTLAKRLQTAQAAAVGVRAALLAERGYDGPAAIFDGPFGFYSMYEPGDPEILLRELGERYLNDEVVFKQYPNCGCSHAVLDGIIDLVTAEDLTPDDVEAVEVVISPYMHRLVGAPFDPTGNPEVTAQFSVQYAVAVAILLRRFTLAELAPELVRDVHIHAIARRVEVTVDPRNEGGVAPAEVRVRRRDGTMVHKRVSHLRGSVDDPLRANDLENKALGCLTLRGRRTLHEAKALFLRTQAIGAIDDVSAFVSACVPDPVVGPNQSTQEMSS